jgi:hypothetical protein
MVVKKQPEPGAAEIAENAADWFRQFLKVLEGAATTYSQDLPPHATFPDYTLAALRAVKFTLLDAGIGADAIVEAFAQVALENVNPTSNGMWNSTLNRRRFQLIDRDIQGVLTQAEKLELIRLTQRMREYTDSEANLPTEGARELHRRLSEFQDKSPGEQR